MQFLVLTSHTADNCPGYAEGDARAASAASMQALPTRAQELGVQLHYALSSGPGHEFFFLVETDSLVALQKLILSVQVKQEIRVVPVQDLQAVSRTLQGAGG